MMKRFTRLLKWLGLTLLVLVLLLLLPLVGVLWECRPFSAVTVEPARPVGAAVEPIRTGLQDYNRLEDQTYLTLPEWYIVYSADEYAAFVANNSPSHFPFFRAVGQYWRSYYNVCRVTRERYPFNSGYHLTLAVIGSSFTLENTVKGIYEGTIGRFTELLTSPELTEEDRYAQQVAQEYGAFIHTIPWYEFPFAEKRQELWASTSWWGPNPLRKWERKLALTAEYGGKAFYAGLIKQGTQAAYAPEKLEIQAWVEGLTEPLLQAEPDLRLVQRIDERAAFVAIPRYEAFTQLVPRLTLAGLRFVEIAGNDEILITAFAPSTWTYDLPAGEFLFALPVLTQPGLNRIAVKAPVPELHLILNELPRRGVQLEHVYDY